MSVLSRLKTSFCVGGVGGGALVVTITSPAYSLTRTVLLEIESTPTAETIEVIFSAAERPLQKLKVSQNGLVEFASGRKKGSPDSFVITVSTANTEAINFVHRQTKKGTQVRFLSVIWLFQSIVSSAFFEDFSIPRS